MSDTKRKGYRLQRTASLGAAITLVARCGFYSALFECATRCAEVLGDRNLTDVGDGILDVIPSYRIPLEDMNSALQKLTKKYSVALVDFDADNHGGRFVAVWRINAQTSEPAPVAPASTNLDDY